MKVSRQRRQPRPRRRDERRSFIHITMSVKRAGLPDCGDGKPCKRFKWCPGPGGWEAGFGFAGGGYGPYSFCPKSKCQRITEKTVMPEDM